jgi:hypothetical protein
LFPMSSGFTMTNAEVTITENATVAEQGAPVARTSSKNGATQIKGARKGQKKRRRQSRAPRVSTKTEAGDRVYQIRK